MIYHETPNYRLPMAALFHAHQALTTKLDAILARHGLARVHHRILFVIANQHGLSVKELLRALGVTKQALHMPIKQLFAMGLVECQPDPRDKRIKHLHLTSTGTQLEAELHQEQAALLEHAFIEAGNEAVQGWTAVCKALARRIAS